MTMVANQSSGGLLHVAAVHESAHAVVGHLRGQTVRERGLTASSDGTGLTDTRSSVIIPRSYYIALSNAAAVLPQADASMEMECAVHLAGYVAEKRLTRERWRSGERPWASADYVNAMRVVNEYLGRAQLPLSADLWMLDSIEALEGVVRRVLRRRGVWEAVLALSQELVASGGFLGHEDATAILQERLPGSWMSYGRCVGETPRPAGVFEDIGQADRHEP